MMSLHVQNMQAPQMATALAPEEFAAIASYAKAKFGLNLPEAKREMVFARLIKRLRRCSIATFSDYLAFVQRSENEAERSEFLSALTTNVTQFFREPHHFDHLKSKILPNLVAKARAGQRVRIWSAGCSTGQEPYTIAMLALDEIKSIGNLDFKILATDIDPRILQTAMACTYPASELAAIPQPLKTQFTQAAGADSFTFSQPVRDLVSFAELNLIEDWPMKGKFDAIFCRNVAIYFDAATQSRLWSRFANQLTSDGQLFIGHSERLSGDAMQMLTSVGVTVYAMRPNHIT